MINDDNGYITCWHYFWFTISPTAHSDSCVVMCCLGRDPLLACVVVHHPILKEAQSFYTPTHLLQSCVARSTRKKSASNTLSQPCSYRWLYCLCSHFCSTCPPLEFPFELVFHLYLCCAYVPLVFWLCSISALLACKDFVTDHYNHWTFHCPT